MIRIFVSIQIQKKVMLYTNLNHIVSAREFAQIIGKNENVMVICGRMEPFCIPVYRMAEELEAAYSDVKFYDLEFDDPNLYFIQFIPEVEYLEKIPYILYFKNGEIVKATSGNQTKTQVIGILEKEFAVAISS